MNGSTTPTGKALSVALTRFHDAARKLAALRRRRGSVAALDLARRSLAIEALAWAEAERVHERVMRAYAKRVVRSLNRLRQNADR